ncbi:helix-turn-helix protein [Blastococcus xanthinilyticus]|uniref:Helix-turn-helix protein n=1 Tax=Blastococcus xanthinilyticus TaxID=1564164 RepID=A0A5S5CQY0_9ACTN|nr:helix-turn-helix protein [Blastococcus xanthinilyticus]
MLHRCDNPPCCNPQHLYAGTPAQNTDDMVSRGRQVAPRSLANGRAKLSDADVAAIREAHAAGESCKAIGRRLDLHPSYVGRLVRRVRRTDLPIIATEEPPTP